MFYHATESNGPHEHIGICSLGIAWSDDLIHWSWPIPVNGYDKLEDENR